MPAAAAWFRHGWCFASEGFYNFRAILKGTDLFSCVYGRKQIEAPCSKLQGIFDRKECGLF
jgi:hypothetical protein